MLPALYVIIASVNRLAHRAGTTACLTRDISFPPNSSKVILIVAIVVGIIAVAAVIAGVVYVVTRSSTEPSSKTKTIRPPPTGPPGSGGPYQHAVVATDAGTCSEVGRDILQRNGSAVDSAVASLFCIGVINMHSAGIGGGGFMVVYNRSTSFVEVFDFREEAPGKANSSMYVDGTMSSRYGATAAGVPGEVKGFHAAWRTYGKLPWKDLVQPSIDLAKNGFQFGYSAHYAATRKSVLPHIKEDPDCGNARGSHVINTGHHVINTCSGN